MKHRHSLISAATLAILGAGAPAVPVAVVAAPDQRMTREEFEAHMKGKLRETQIADKLEFWHSQALLHLVAAGVPEAEAFTLAMRLAESACTFREWELWPQPEDVVAQHVKDNSL